MMGKIPPLDSKEKDYRALSIISLSCTSPKNDSNPIILCRYIPTAAGERDRGLTKIVRPLYDEILQTND